MSPKVRTTDLPAYLQSAHHNAGELLEYFYFCLQNHKPDFSFSGSFGPPPLMMILLVTPLSLSLHSTSRLKLESGRGPHSDTLLGAGGGGGGGEGIT